MAVWVVRAGRDSEIIEQVEEHQVIAIGWLQMQDMSDLKTLDDFKKRYAERYPDRTTARVIGKQARQAHRFVREIEVGDTVLTPNSPAREVLIGEVAGEYRYNPDLIDGYPQVRKMVWKMRVSRDDMSNRMRKATSNRMTVYRLESLEEEVEQLLAGHRGPWPGDGDEIDGSRDFYEETRATAGELISDIIASIDAFDFQDLVASVLRAMGFRTRVSPPGPDGGKDIVAHRDALGFEQPRVKVAIGAPDVRNFRAVIRPGENGLFVSTGGFTKDALQEPEHAGQPLTLMDRDKFVDLLTENYDKLEPEFQAMVPLKKVYIPVTVG